MPGERDHQSSPYPHQKSAKMKVNSPPQIVEKYKIKVAASMHAGAVKKEDIAAPSGLLDYVV